MIPAVEPDEVEETSLLFRVMIVDDQKVMRKIIRKLIGHSDVFGIVEAENGRDAMDKLLTDENIPDVIISDLHMDEMDGLAFCNALRRIRNSRLNAIPVILLTGESDQMVLDVSRQVGAMKVLQKPISAPDLQGHLSDVLGFQLGS